MVTYASLCIYWKWPGSVLSRVQPYVVILSCFMLNLVLGSYITFGNLLPYIVSYIRERSSPDDLHFTHGTYIFAAQAAGIGGTMILGGILDQYLGPRVVILCSGLIVCVGVAVSYFTIQHSFWLFMLSYGIVYGVGTGLSYMSVVASAVKWMPKWKGLVSGFVLSGVGISPFIINAIQTGFVNPGNQSPDDSPSPHEQYFTQPEVLDRIPLLFALLGLVYIVIICVMSIFIALPYPEQIDNENETKKIISKKQKDIEQNNNLTTDTCLQVSPTSEQKNHTTDEQTTSFCADSAKSISNSKPAASKSASKSAKKAAKKEKPVVVCTPVMMFKQLKFYHLCTMFILGVTVNSFVLALYKSFGFEEITSDDHFLTIVGSSSAVFNFIGHITWGLIADLADYQLAIVVHSGYITVIMFTLYTTAVGGKIMFFIWLCGLFFGIGGYFSIFPAASAENFGQKHLATNYGITIGIAFVFGSLLSACISHALIDYIHWYGNFLFLGGLSLIELVLALLLHAYKVKG